MKHEWKKPKQILLKDLMWLMREKGRRKWGKIHSASLFLFLFWTFILGGGFVALLVWLPFCLSGVMATCSQETPLLLQTLLSFSWDSSAKLWFIWKLGVSVMVLQFSSVVCSSRERFRNSHLPSPCLCSFISEWSSVMDLRLVFISLFPLRHPPQVSQASHLHTNHCLGFGVTFGSPRLCS